MRARESAQRLARGAGKVSTRPGGRFAQPLSAGRRGTVEGLVGRLGFEIQVMQLAVAGTGVQPVRRLDQHLADRGFRTGPRGLEAARRPAPAGPCSAASTRARNMARSLSNSVCAGWPPVGGVVRARHVHSFVVVRADRGDVLDRLWWWNY